MAPQMNLNKQPNLIIIMKGEVLVRRPEVIDLIELTESKTAARDLSQVRYKGRVKDDEVETQKKQNDDERRKEELRNTKARQLN